MRKKFLFFIDALRYDLISREYTPFLFSLRESGKSTRVIPSFGFEPDKAIFFGLEPEIYNGGMHFQLRKRPNFVYKKLYWVDMLPGRKIWRKALQYSFRIISRNERFRRTATLAEIPLEFYGYFEPVEKEMPLNYSPIYRKKSILSLLTQKRNFDYWGFPYKKINILHPGYYVKQFRKQRLDSVLIYIHQLDGVGHKYGPESYETKGVLSRIDQFIQEFIGAFSGESMSICVFGDHGMAPVKKHFDLISLLKKLPLKLHIDYIYFIDSVFARFWIFNNNAKKVLLEFLHGITYGTLINLEEAKHYNINYKDNRFGDIIFWAKDYVEFFPNFWNISVPSKGMHGYRETCLENHTIFIAYSNYNSITLTLKNYSRSPDLYEYLLAIL